MAKVSYQQFLSALNSVQEASMKGDDAAIGKFSLVLHKLMPDELADGRYRMLGGLLLRLDELMPLFSSSFKSNSVLVQKLEHHVRDILESVTFVLKKFSSGEQFDPAAVKQILEILSMHIKGMEKLKKKFLKRSAVEDMAEKNQRGIVCHPSPAMGRVIIKFLEKLGMRLELAAELEEISTFLYLFEGEYGMILLDLSLIESELEKRIQELRKLAPTALIIVTANETKLNPQTQARLSALGCRVVPCPPAVNEAALAKIKEAVGL